MILVGLVRSRPRHSSRRAFTLIELMVVILIIAILASLLMAALGGGGRGRDAKTLVEINEMATALEAYRTKYGEYPPLAFNNSLANQSRIRAHLMKAFPKFMPVVGSPTDPVPVLVTLRSDQALVFWLGGMPVSGDGTPTGTGKGTEGFSQDPSNPFATTQYGTWTAQRVAAPGGTQRTDPLFRFDPLRLRQPDPSTGGNPAFWVYVPEGKQSSYVYFPSEMYGQSATAGRPFRYTQAAAGQSHTAVPYRLSPVAGAADLTNKAGWASPGTFQIIAAGEDDLFGENAGASAAYDFRIFPTGENYSPNAYDDDNLTNFSRIRLGRAKP